MGWVTSFRPQARLERQVERFTVIGAADGESHVVLPTTAVVLGFQFLGRVQAEQQLLSPAGVPGLPAGPRTYSYRGSTGSVLVHFTTQGAATLGVPVDELTNASVSLDALLPRARVAEALERLQEAADDEARVGVVENVLLELPFARDRAVSLAIERLIRPDGPALVAAVARELGLSERQLERRFRARVGLTPKRFASLARFERAVSLANGTSTLAQVAAAAGYFDQSHLSRDFRRFGGGAPSRLRTG